MAESQRKRLVRIDPETGHRYDMNTGRKLPPLKPHKAEVIRRPIKSQKRLTPKVFQERDKYNPLKYWRVVRYWAERKYDITTIELEILFFLYDEGLFTKSKYNEHEGLVCWDKSRFTTLQEKGYIVVWRNENKRTPEIKKLYTLSKAAQTICETCYKKLLGEEAFPEKGQYNPVMKGKTHMDKVYKKAMLAMNKRRAEKLKALESKQLDSEFPG